MGAFLGVELKNCPFCGWWPDVFPLDDTKGSCWGLVMCSNLDCVARPKVKVGIGASYDRVCSNYKLEAIRRWNVRSS